ncbi:MAG: hypothetical protein AEth_01975 [Candidatus Argoarchaeum ethanivorans]|uniref:Uncharacterized protein n=1 Tax=Candidatus Argoarchaeum ethanivorans TaxID=2608793 RepID=A0A8B3RYT7_9EURY|nr:MAG: hypothetical protein AEth_01975 [Candidatus Argoarchaeum ethanivorans]
MKGKKQKNNPYSKNKFEYDEKRDCFICPNEEVLIKKGSMNTMARYSINITGQIVRSVYLEWISAGKGKMKQITSDEYGVAYHVKQLSDTSKVTRTKQSHKRNRWPSKIRNTKDSGDLM